ncbi:hypothetical protein Bca4012_095282 [Brassica carinata]
MLDLSLGMFSNYGEDQDRKVPFVSTAGDEEYNISSSSSKDSVAGKDFITFGILKRDDDVVPPPPPSRETGDLFPVADARRNIEFAADDGHWLRLSSLQRNKQQVAKKSRRGPRSRSSQAYDRAAIKFRGLDADINFVVEDYKQDLDKMKNLNKVEFVQTLRRESASFGRGSSKYKGLTLQKCTQLKTHHDQIHLFQNRGWDAAAIKYNNELGKGGVMKSGAPIKGNIHNDLELSLGISSSSQNIKLTTSDYYKGINHSTMGLFGKHSPIYLPVTTMNPLKTVAASSGFPFITMTTSSSSSMSTSFDP